MLFYLTITGIILTEDQLGMSIGDTFNACPTRDHQTDEVWGDIYVGY